MLKCQITPNSSNIYKMLDIRTKIIKSFLCVVAFTATTWL